MVDALELGEVAHDGQRVEGWKEWQLSRRKKCGAEKSIICFTGQWSDRRNTHE
jgi:hypothetical protein